MVHWDVHSNTCSKCLFAPNESHLGMRVKLLISYLQLSGIALHSCLCTVQSDLLNLVTPIWQKHARSGTCEPRQRNCDHKLTTGHQGKLSEFAVGHQGKLSEFVAPLSIKNISNTFMWPNAFSTIICQFTILLFLCTSCPLVCRSEMEARQRRDLLVANHSKSSEILCQPWFHQAPACPKSPSF